MNAGTKALDELTELEVLEWWAIEGQSRFLGVELETVLREQGYLMGALGITEAGLWRLEVLRHEQTKAQLASMTEERNQWERIAHGSLEAIERIAATLDIPTRLPDSALGVDYLTLEKAIIEALEDMAE